MHTPHDGQTAAPAFTGVAAAVSAWFMDHGPDIFLRFAMSLAAGLGIGLGHYLIRLWTGRARKP